MRRMLSMDQDNEAGERPTRAILTGRRLPIEPHRLPPRGKGGFRPLRRWGFGLSDNSIAAAAGAAAAGVKAAPLGFWGSIGSTLGGIVSSVLPSFAQIEIAKRQTAAGAALYTPQNIEILRRQAEFEAQERANRAAAAAGSTSAPVSTNTLLIVGGGLAAVLLFLNMRKK